ncbi:MAG: transposase [Gammaproteobacteria bacterium]
MCVIDGVFSEDALGEPRFHPATDLSPSDVAAVEGLVRHRVLQLFERTGLLDPEAAENMRRWCHAGGFSLDASVCVEAHDRAGLERLLRYCARPAFSLERLSWRIEGERVVYRLPKPRPEGTQHIELGVSELLERLSQLRPPPRRHRHHYHGVLAPNAPMRPAVTARAGQPLEGAPRRVSSPAVDKSAMDKLSPERLRRPAS